MLIWCWSSSHHRPVAPAGPRTAGHRSAIVSVTTVYPGANAPIPALRHSSDCPSDWKLMIKRRGVELDDIPRRRTDRGVARASRGRREARCRWAGGVASRRGVGVWVVETEVTRAASKKSSITSRHQTLRSESREGVKQYHQSSFDLSRAIDICGARRGADRVSRVRGKSRKTFARHFIASRI